MKIKKLRAFNAWWTFAFSFSEIFMDFSGRENFYSLIGGRKYSMAM